MWWRRGVTPVASDAVLYRREGHVAHVTINRPHVRNCLDPAANRRLGEIWLAFRDDPEAWVGVLTGTGEEAFCAGADLKAVAGGLTPADLAVPFGGLTRDLELDKPVIAAINGACLGGGLELALCCDIRLAAEHARFGLPEVRWGMIPAAGGTQRLPRSIALPWAMEILLTGSPIAAAEALRMGLVNRVVAAADLAGAAEELAGTLASRAPLAMRAVKRAVLAGMGLPLAEGLAVEDRIARDNRTTEDYREGPRAFQEKRPPEFKGR